MKFLVLAVFFCVCSINAHSQHLINDVPLQLSDQNFQAVIEIPAGTNEKWETDLDTGKLFISSRNGQKRIVRFLAYPFNYGFFPQTLLSKGIGGDGDALDVAVIGISTSRGKVVRVRPIGVLKMIDRGEKDDKVLAVPVDSVVFGKIQSLGQLDKEYPGATDILKMFFYSYHGQGTMNVLGWGDEDEASQLIRLAAEEFKKSS